MRSSLCFASSRCWSNLASICQSSSLGNRDLPVRKESVVRIYCLDRLLLSISLAMFSLWPWFWHSDKSTLQIFVAELLSIILKWSTSPTVKVLSVSTLRTAIPGSKPAVPPKHWRRIVFKISIFLVVGGSFISKFGFEFFCDDSCPIWTLISRPPCCSCLISSYKCALVIHPPSTKIYSFQHYTKCHFEKRQQWLRKWAKKMRVSTLWLTN